jgi:hypothetical protein
MGSGGGGGDLRYRSVANVLGEISQRSGINKFLNTYDAQKNFKFLEKNLEHIYGGVTYEIRDKLSEFLAWKTHVSSLRSADFLSMDALELGSLITSHIPPLIEADDELDYSDDATGGDTSPPVGISSSSNSGNSNSGNSSSSAGGRNAAVEGIWAHGKELSVIQSLIFQGAVAPSSLGSSCSFYFALLVSYLLKGQYPPTLYCIYLHIYMCVGGE